MDLIRRHLAGKIARTPRTSRVINIVGPRQTGKTTLVRDMLQAARFLTPDDDGPLSSLALDPAFRPRLATRSLRWPKIDLPVNWAFQADGRGFSPIEGRLESGGSVS
jgi:hypothetical protein